MKDMEEDKAGTGKYVNRSNKYSIRWAIFYQIYLYFMYCIIYPALGDIYSWDSQKVIKMLCISTFIMVFAISHSVYLKHWIWTIPIYFLLVQLYNPYSKFYSAGIWYNAGFSLIVLGCEILTWLIRYVLGFIFKGKR